MTEKQLRILDVAMKLFASHGFNGVSTGSIAKEASVSEGLIFKHFGSKQGLLDAILEEGSQKAEAYYEEIMQIDDPASRLVAAVELPFTVAGKDLDYWRLLYSLKWQKQNFEHSNMELYLASITDAFRKLGFKNARIEAELLMVFYDGLATALLLGNQKNKLMLLKLMRDKYGLN